MILEQLAVALGLGALCGINLYLTVFAAGLAIRMGWIVLDPQFQHLAVLGDAWILVVAGILYACEFLADKVPWVDSLNDAIHTLIRPLGAALLAITVLGDATPVFDVIVGLLTGSVALATHTAKAGMRLIANASPEPVSNVALSVTEDVVVLGGLSLVFSNPYLAAALGVGAVVGVAYFMPRVWRLIKTRVRFAWSKLKAPAGAAGGTLPTYLPADAEILLHRLLSGKPTVAWALPAVTGKVPGVPNHVDGWLVGANEDPKHWYFLVPGRAASASRILDLAGYKAVVESRFLTENLVLFSTEKGKPKRVFLFERPMRELVAEVARKLAERCAQAKPQEAALT